MQDNENTLYVVACVAHVLVCHVFLYSLVKFLFWSTNARRLIHFISHKMQLIYWQVYFLEKIIFFITQWTFFYGF